MRETDCLLARLEVKPDDVDIYFDLVDAYDREGNLSEAKSILTCLLQKPLSLEDWGHAKRWLGWIYYKENKFNLTLQVAEELLEANLDDLQTGYAHHLMGLCLMEKYHYTEQAMLSAKCLDEATHHFRQAAELVENGGEEQTEILWGWGTALRLQNRLDRAIEVLNSALGIVPAESKLAGMCYEQLGLAYSKLEKHEKAVLNLEEAARVLLNDDPDYSLTWVYTTLSRTYTQLQQYDQALSNAQRALYSVNRSEEGWEFQLSAAHEVCGDVYYYSEFDLSLARKHYKEYLKLLNKEELTEHARVLIKLANIEIMKGKYKQALRDFKKVLTLKAPGIDYGKVCSAMGDCAYGLGNFKEAVQAYKSAIEHGDNEKDTIVHRCRYLGHSLFELERYKEAADAYREGLKYVDPKASERAELMKYLVAANELKDH